MADNAKYMTSGVTYSEQQAPNRSNWLRVDMFAFPHDNICTGSHNLEIKLYTYENDNQEIFFQGSLNELIELILLGKLYKAQLQAMDKKEPIVASEIRELQNNG